jgi:hypothetical protein
MRLLVLAALLLAYPASAQAPAAPVPDTAPKGAKPPVVDCLNPGITHARRPERSGPQRLAELPQAWKLHTVQRLVNGCQVHPEARRVNDRRGGPGPEDAPRR